MLVFVVIQLLSPERAAHLPQEIQKTLEIVEARRVGGRVRGLRPGAAACRRAGLTVALLVPKQCRACEGGCCAPSLNCTSWPPTGLPPLLPHTTHAAGAGRSATRAAAGCLLLF